MIDVEAILNVLDRDPPDLDISDVEVIANWIDERQKAVEALSEVVPALLSEKVRRRVIDALHRTLDADEIRLGHLAERRRDVEEAVVRAQKAKVAVNAYGGLRNATGSGVQRRA
jgi:hypothetical protein